MLAVYWLLSLVVARPRPAELLPSFRTDHETRAQLSLSHKSRRQLQARIGDQ